MHVQSSVLSCVLAHPPVRFLSLYVIALQCTTLHHVGFWARLATARGKQRASLRPNGFARAAPPVFRNFRSSHAATESACPLIMLISKKNRTTTFAYLFKGALLYAVRQVAARTACTLVRDGR